MKKLLLALMLLLPAGISYSQPGGLLRLIDGYLIRRQQEQPFDTAYILKPQEKWLVGTATNLSHNAVHAYWKENGIRYSQRFDQGHFFSQNVRVGYRGISLSISLAKLWVGKPFEDLSLSYSYFGNSWGFDWYYLHSGSFRGTSLINGVKVLLDGTLFENQSMNLDTYYVFNNKKFSMPAAISQGYIQKRSAGSIILTMSGNLTVQATDQDPGQLTNYMTSYVSLGCGYGYNFVVRKHWLIHSSVTPSIILLDLSKQTGESNIEVNNPLKPLDFCGTATMAAIYNADHYYLGVHLVNHGTFLGDYNSFQTDITRLQASVKFGYRF